MSLSIDIGVGGFGKNISKFNPLEISGLTRWFDFSVGVYADNPASTPATNGSFVQVVEDQSGNNLDLYAPNISPTTDIPTYSTTESTPCMVCNAQALTDTGSFSMSTSLWNTQVVVWKKLDATGITIPLVYFTSASGLYNKFQQFSTGYLSQASNSGTLDTNVSDIPIAQNGKYIDFCTWQQAPNYDAYMHRFQGGSLISSTGNPFLQNRVAGANRYILGGFGSFTTTTGQGNMEYYEVMNIVSATRLTDAQMIQIGQYLASKHGVA